MEAEETKGEGKDKVNSTRGPCFTLMMPTSCRGRRGSLAKTMEVTVKTCETFYLTVSGKKTEMMCMRGLQQPAQSIDIAAAGQRCAHTTDFVHLGTSMNEEADPTSEVKCRIQLAWFRSIHFSWLLYDRSVASLDLNVQILKAGALQVLLYGCATW